MIFNGLSMTFSTENGIQYESIGCFWDYLSSLYGRKNLRGLGFNWQNGNSIEYAIGFYDGDMSFDMKKISKKYPSAVLKNIELPDTGWKTYEGKTSELSRMYDDIYSEGALTYEIERFFDDGKCIVMITRDLLS